MPHSEHAFTMVQTKYNALQKVAMNYHGIIRACIFPAKGLALTYRSSDRSTYLSIQLVGDPHRG